ncbi:MAG: PIN domain-containing protein [Anaerolineales bacterium]|nr:PIN domain-containing protein [Anaerolineales bacterium]
MRRVFVDANVLMAGADSRSGASHVVLRLAEAGLFRLVVCRQVLDEAERNLRKKLPRALPAFAALLAELPLEIVADPDDESCQQWAGVIERKDTPILAAAVDAQVDRLITLNTRDFTPAVAKASGLRIQTPGRGIWGCWEGI